MVKMVVKEIYKDQAAIQQRNILKINLQNIIKRNLSINRSAETVKDKSDNLGLV